MKYNTRPRKITSKNQIALPAQAVREFGSNYYTIQVDADNKRMILEPVETESLEDLAGSISTPKHLKGKEIEDIIHTAKDSKAKEISTQDL